MTDARQASQRLATLLHRERSCLAEFLVALAAFDADRGWAELGYATLFQYLERELKLTSSAAAARQTAVRLIRQLPSIVAPIRDGRICMSVVYEVAKVVTPANADEVLPRFFGLSRRAAEELVAALRPAGNVPMREVVTAIGAARPRVSAALGPGSTFLAAPAAPQLLESRGASAASPREAAGGSSATTAAVPERTPTSESEWVLSPAPPPEAAAALRAPSAKPRDDVEPLTDDLRRYHVTVSKAFLAKLQQAKDAVSHAIPDGDTEAVLSAAIDLLLERTARRRGLVNAPRPAPAVASNDPHHIPAAVSREVWQRDGSRCVFPLADGSACGSTTRLQLDHVVPVALGGRSEAGNLRVACERHNQLAARRVLGDELVDLHAARGGRGHRAPAAARLSSG